VDAIVNSITGQLAAQRRSDGQWSETMRNAATATCRLLDSPHPATLGTDVANAFWARFYELLEDKEHIARVAEWRLSNDRLATGVAIFKQHVRFAAAKALFETMEA